jgi:hypothetical protein
MRWPFAGSGGAIVPSFRGGAESANPYPPPDLDFVPRRDRDRASRIPTAGGTFPCPGAHINVSAYRSQSHPKVYTALPAGLIAPSLA